MNANKTGWNLIFINSGLDKNWLQYKRNYVATCKMFEAHKKLFYLFHLYVSSLFVLTSFPLSLLLQNSVPSGKTVPKNARKLYKALKVYIYILKITKVLIYAFTRQAKASKQKNWLRFLPSSAYHIHPNKLDHITPVQVNFRCEGKRQCDFEKEIEWSFRGARESEETEASVSKQNEGNPHNSRVGIMSL